ncbi:MAG: erythromycin esterase [Halobacteriovoraceae bacterium]|nr:erythromycin esterase [Halobacteriovoraceae bacterium]
MLSVSGLRNERIGLNVKSPDFGPLMDEIKNRKIVLIGESTHGTHDFYKLRAEITKELISEHGFNVVAIEGDWPDVFRVNKYVKGQGKDKNALDSMVDMERFPLWMWRNQVCLDFIEWLRDRNLNSEFKTGFYGLDLYGMKNSISAIMDITKENFPELYEETRELYSCFQTPLSDAANYGRRVALNQQRSCQEQMVKELNLIRDEFYQSLGSGMDKEEYLHVEQNAQAVVAAESYYRNLFTPGVSTWNIRDKHMFETLKSIDEWISSEESGKIVVWAHNSHVGRAMTDRREQLGEITLGEVASDHYKDMCFCIGMFTGEGSVTAAHNWDEPGHYFNLNTPLEGSYEQLLSRVGGDFMLGSDTLKEMKRPLLERAVGVIYRPETERYSHYFESDIAGRYDWLIYLDKTSALEPVDDLSYWQPRLKGREKDFYPSSL